MTQPDDLANLAGRWAADEQLAAEAPSPAEAARQRQDGGYEAPILTEPTASASTADPAGDAARQKLRLMERGVRRWKLVARTALTEDARARAQARVRELQTRIREHVATTEVTRQRYREQLFLDNQPPLT